MPEPQPDHQPQKTPLFQTSLLQWQAQRKARQAEAAPGQPAAPAEGRRLVPYQKRRRKKGRLR